jgi:predicted 3-demethylubiquinone-9 3-methyltransferase (glyoxalase superfamily)
MPPITTCLWFDNDAEAAATFYTSVFPNSRIGNVSHYSEGAPKPAGTVLTVEFELDGRAFTALNGGPEFTFTEAISFQISCQDQAEVDHYADALTADGGEEGPCGWVKDRFGLSWQIVPVAMIELFSDPDPERRNRAMAAMMKMQRLDIAALHAAADG